MGNESPETLNGSNSPGKDVEMDSQPSDEAPANWLLNCGVRKMVPARPRLG